jgi:hypothetical protein
MPITMQADLECEASNCAKTAKLVFTRDPFRGADWFHSELPKGWTKERFEGKERVLCPDHS